MGYRFTADGLNAALKELSKDHAIFAPVCFTGGGAFSDTDAIRYKEIQEIEEVVFDKKSSFSFKELLLPISETLFYFTEESVKEADGPKKGAVVFLRSCDLHAVKRLDEIYLKNGFEDYYYQRIRNRVKFVLMGCEKAFENCFCVDMGTNQTDFYDGFIEPEGDTFKVGASDEHLEKLFDIHCSGREDLSPSFVSETNVRVNIPEGITIETSKSKMWDEYDGRCIACGRCNFVCPTCTCFTMQDIYYTDNGKAGERRRVWASCMVDGFTEVAGGGSYRQKNGQRMRFKVLHKVYDYKERNGYHMCVGCGRCDDVCPEYISFSDCINKLGDAIEEVQADENK